jgi:hypothetical protein
MTNEVARQQLGHRPVICYLLSVVLWSLGEMAQNVLCTVFYRH